MREVRQLVGEPPRGAGTRVVILAEAQALTDEAANALLKAMGQMALTRGPPRETSLVMATSPATKTPGAAVSRKSSQGMPSGVPMPVPWSQSVDGMTPLPAATRSTSWAVPSERSKR